MRVKIIIAAACALLLLGVGCQKGANNAGMGDENIPSLTGAQTQEGTREDSDGFVYYPGEPSREDKSYYIVEDLCGQFTAKFMSGLMNKQIYSVTSTSYDPEYTCKYYVATKENGGADRYVSIHLAYLNYEKQKKGLQFLDYKLEKEPRIKMEHEVVLQKDGLINEVIFKLSDNKFISLNRSSALALTEQEARELAVKFAAKIKNFK